MRGFSKPSGLGWQELVGDSVRSKFEASHTLFPTIFSQPGPDCLLARLSYVWSDRIHRMHVVQDMKEQQRDEFSHLVSTSTFREISIKSQMHVTNLDEPNNLHDKMFSMLI